MNQSRFFHKACSNGLRQFGLVSSWLLLSIVWLVPFMLPTILRTVEWLTECAMTNLAKDWTCGTVRFPKPSDIEAVESRWAQWQTLALDQTDNTVAEFVDSAKQQQVVKDCLNAIFGNSPYLSQNILADPSLAQRIFFNGVDEVVEHSIRDLQNPRLLGHETRTELMVRLRTAKTTVATAAAIADIGLHRPVMQITKWLSELAATSLQATCNCLLRELHDRGQAVFPEPDNPVPGSGLIVLGMGKLGAGELNFSSDIDLIILFADDSACFTAGSHQRLFSRLARNLVGVMARRTAEGYVFRTDLRLRPDPSTTPPAVSVRRALRYYRTLAQTWERAAMIKAKPVAGDLVAGSRFLENNAGFVWRRYLDFPAMRDIQAIKRKINLHKGSKSIVVEGQNVKLGRGGIREIEFLTQTQQLIWGGQDTSLRGRKTIDMLNRLANAGRITVRAANDLQSAYRFLRRLEHRIQMINDQQTHSLPNDAEGVDSLATFFKFENPSDFRAALIANLRIVEVHYNSMFEDSSTEQQDTSLDFSCEKEKAKTIAALNGLGFSDSEAVYKKVNSWLAGYIRATHTNRARSIFAEFAVPLIKEFAATVDPTRTFERFDGLLGRLSRSINLFSAMSAEPALLRLVADIMGAAPRLADWISQQPSLLEGVLQSDFQQLDPSLGTDLEPEIAEAARRGLVRLFYEREFRSKQMLADLDGQIATEVGNSPDLQSVLDAQRRWVRNRKFQLGIHMLRGDMTPIQASTPLTSIAEVCLASLMTRIKREFAEIHGSIKGGQLAIIACGRLGSQEMTLASDLDLIFVYNHSRGDAQSDGKKTLLPTQYYARFCRRFLSAVTSPTAEGRLYEVDMRLRPSGKSGPIACSIERFENYQESDAWTWEHQALTRARVIYAEGHLGRRVQSIIRSVLTQKRSRKKLAGDIQSMRERIKKELENPTRPTIKYRRGGILDAEFIAQFLQLLHAEQHPSILKRDACSVFVEIEKLGLIDERVATELHRDLVFWRNLQGIMMLTADTDQIETSVATVLRRTFGQQDAEEVRSSFVAAMEETSERIALHFDTVVS